MEEKEKRAEELLKNLLRGAERQEQRLGDAIHEATQYTFTVYEGFRKAGADAEEAVLLTSMMLEVLYKCAR